MEMHVIKLRTLREEASLGFSGWALSAIRCILIKETRRWEDTEKGEGTVSTEAETGSAWP